MSSRDPLFRFYYRHKGNFDTFIVLNGKELAQILTKNFGNFGYGVRSWDKLPEDYVIEITGLAASESGMRGIHDDLKESIKKFSEKFKPIEFEKETLLSSFPEHWKNIGHYCFIIVFLRMKKGSN